MVENSSSYNNKKNKQQTKRISQIVFVRLINVNDVCVFVFLCVCGYMHADQHLFSGGDQIAFLKHRMVLVHYRWKKMTDQFSGKNLLIQNRVFLYQYGIAQHLSFTGLL